MVLLIFPGIYWGLKYQFTIYLIIDKGLGIKAAMQESARMTNGKKSSLFWFDFVCACVMILGAICLGVGVLVAMPVVWLAGATVYRKLASSSVAV